MLTPNQNVLLQQYLWAINSDPLFDATYLDAFKAYHTLVSPPVTLWPHVAHRAALEDETDPVLWHALESAMTAQSSHFIGPRFETLWQTYFQSHPDFELLAANLQVPALTTARRGNRQRSTVGEFDFLVTQRSTQRTWHIETTVKYYLGLPSPSYTSSSKTPSITSSPRPLNTRWLGPNCIDRLDRKLTNALEKQLTLAQHPAAEALLNSLGISAPLPGLLTRGELYSPLLVPEAEGFVPDTGLTAPKHHRWTRLAHLDEAIVTLEQRFNVDAWACLSKQAWLGPAIAANCTFRGSMESVRSHVTEEHRPWLLAGFCTTQEPPCQVCRLFVVPDDWPFISPEDLESRRYA